MSKKGFTLTEVVIASAILLLSLSALIGTVVMFKRYTFMASNRLEALHEARDHMETLLSLSYSHTSLYINTHAFAFSTGKYGGSYTVSSNASYPGIKDISLTVNWTNPIGTMTSSVTINSSISSALHE